jgi:hypothetical protein
MPAMEILNYQDLRHLQAAEGWLGLGLLNDATLELENIAPQLRSHPEVLAVRWHIHAAAREWEQAGDIARRIADLVPEILFGWGQLAFALHQMKRTREAWDVLFPVADKFPKEFVVPYDLACYACQMGNLNEAVRWLKKACTLARRKDVKRLALEDRDLEPLWANIQKI